MIWVCHFHSIYPSICHSDIQLTAGRILSSWYLLGQDSPSYPPTNFNAFLPDDPATNEHIDVQADHATLARKLAAASVVLLKNEGGVLPLGAKDRTLALIGSGAGPGSAGPNEFPDQVRWRLRLAFQSIIQLFFPGRLRWCSCYGMGFRNGQFPLYCDCTSSLLLCLCKTSEKWS